MIASPITYVTWEWEWVLFFFKLALKHLHKNTKDFNNDCHNLKSDWCRKKFWKKWQGFEGHMKSGYLEVNFNKPKKLKKSLSACSCHVMYAFQSKSTLCSCLNVKELLADIMGLDFKMKEMTPFLDIEPK